MINSIYGIKQTSIIIVLHAIEQCHDSKYHPSLMISLHILNTLLTVKIINSFADKANWILRYRACASAFARNALPIPRMWHGNGLFFLTIIVLLATQMFVVWLNTCILWSLVHVAVAQYCAVARKRVKQSCTHTYWSNASDKTLRTNG